MKECIVTKNVAVKAKAAEQKRTISRELSAMLRTVYITTVILTALQLLSQLETAKTKLAVIPSKKEHDLFRLGLSHSDSPSFYIKL